MVGDRSLTTRDPSTPTARPCDPPERPVAAVVARERGKLEQLSLELEPGADHAVPAQPHVLGVGRRGQRDGLAASDQPVPAGRTGLAPLQAVGSAGPALAEQGAFRVGQDAQCALDRVSGAVGGPASGA